MTFGNGGDATASHPPDDHTFSPGQWATIASGSTPVDDDQLLATRRAGDDAHVPPRHTELVRQQPDQARVGGPFDRGCHHPDLQDAIDDVLDALDRGPRRQADGEAGGWEAQDLGRRAMGASWANGIDPSLPAERHEGQPTADQAAGRHGSWWARSPNSARPTRTIVAPSSTASSKSSVIPIESAGPSPGQPTADSLRELAQAAERPSRLGRVARQPPDRHQTADREVRQREELVEGRLELVGREAGLGRIEIDVDLEQDRIARVRAGPRARAGRAAARGRPSRPSGSIRRPRAPGAPCSTGADRPAASARRAPRAPWRRPPGPGSRRGGRARPPPRRAAPRPRRSSRRPRG